MNENLIEAIAVTAELCGAELSEAAVRLMCEELGEYPLEQALEALKRCRREVQGRFTLAAVIERMAPMDGRPGPEEAWAMCPQDEDKTVCMTEEMAQAWGVAKELLDAKDKVGARVAFREVYTRLVTDARTNRVAPKWFMSLGHDRETREGPIMQAIQEGKIAREHAVQLLGSQPAYDLPRLARPTTEKPSGMGEAIGNIVGRIAKGNALDDADQAILARIPPEKGREERGGLKFVYHCLDKLGVTDVDQRKRLVAGYYLRETRAIVGSGAPEKPVRLDPVKDRARVQGRLDEMARDYYASSERVSAGKALAEEARKVGGTRQQPLAPAEKHEAVDEDWAAVSRMEARELEFRHD